MDNRGQLPLVVFGLIFVGVIVGMWVFGSGFQLPQMAFPNLSLRAILCGGAGGDPACDFFDPATWINCVGYNLCLTVLPFIAAVVLAVIVVAYVISLFPPIASVPIAWLVVGIIAFILGFLVSAFVLDYWYLLAIIGLVFVVVKKWVSKNA